MEDRDFKDRELGEEWWYYILEKGYAEERKTFMVSYKEKTSNPLAYPYVELDFIKLTPRKLLQLLGTEAGRHIIHPDIWVNALFADYGPVGDNLLEGEVRKVREEDLVYPSWIITDVRFPNEVKAIEDRGGIVIRVDRWIDEELTKEKALELYEEGFIGIYGIDNQGIESLLEDEKDFDNFERFVIERKLDLHKSETALDLYEGFHATLNNNGTIEELIEKIKNLNLV